MKKSIRKSAEYLQKFSQILQSVQFGMRGLVFPLKEVPAQIPQLLNHAQEMQQIAQQMGSLRSITLFGQDYTNFCFFIIYGSEMADYLLSTQRSSQLSRRHALRWKELAVKFTPFLQANTKD